MRSIFMQARTALETKGRFAAGAVPEHIGDSWRRCLQNGMDPTGEPVDANIGIQALRETRQQHDKVLSVVRPELELLSNQIAGTNHMTAFASDEGVILDVIMDHEFSDSDCSRSIRAGTIWREDLRGTNALGLSLHTGETSMVTGGEHFFSKHGRVSCVSTPIFDSQGQIIGLLDASSEVAARQFHTQALVGLSATNIENRLFVGEHREDYIIQFHPREEYLTTQSVGMISADEDGKVTGMNRRASQILKGLEIGQSKSFTDFFQGGFSAAIKPLAKGDVIRLVDWLNSTYFARIRMTRRGTRGSGPKRSVSLAVPTVFDLPTASDEPVFRDEQVRNSLRLAVRSARLGAPFSIVGESGTGRTTLAQAVHNTVHKDRPLVAVDCRAASAQAGSKRLVADILGETETHDFAIKSGGTLLLEHLDTITGGPAEELCQVTERLLSSKATPGWVIISTGVSQSDTNTDWPTHVSTVFSRLTELQVHLPALSDRSDFGQVAASMLSGISPRHHLSNSAIEALKRVKRDQHLSDFENQLRILAVQCPEGVIREEHIERFLTVDDIKQNVCPKCRGNSAKEAKCSEINRVFRQCNSNVALAARKLGVSRNTVYSHISDH